MSSIDDIDTLPEEMLIDNCKSYLNILKDLAANGIRNPLLRGSKQPYEKMTKLNVKKRERAMNMDDYTFEITDNWFKNNFNIAARSSTVFSTTDIEQANDYGFSHYMFPIGSFNTIHSNNVKDLYILLNKRNTGKKAIQLYGAKEIPQEYQYAIDYYYYQEPENYAEIIRHILNDADYQKNDVRNAFTSGHEIMIKTKSYYMIPMDTWVEDFLDDFIYDEI